MISPFSKHPLISVLIPTYNRRLELFQSLSSLAQQTLQDFEICLVNDAGVSVKDIVALFPILKINLLELTNNGGHVAARLEALKMARGDYIAFCDDDDLYLPNHLADLMTAIGLGDFAYSDVEIVLYKLTKSERIPLQRLPFAFQFDADLLLKTNYIVTTGILYKKSLHDTLGVYDNKISQHWDWDWILRASRHTPFIHVSKMNALYTFNQSGTNSSANQADMQQSLNSFTTKHKLGQLPTTNFYRMAMETALRPWQIKSQQIWDGQMPQVPPDIINEA